MLPSWVKDLTHKYLADGRSWFQREEKIVEVITVHHTASNLNDTEEAILKSIFATHNGKNGWPGFAYCYFYIPKRFTKGFSGKWIKLNNHTDVTWHDTVNWDSLGICIHGYYHPDINNTLEPEDFINIKKMLDWLSKENPQFPAEASNVFGHRDRSQTACPGNYLYPYVTEYRTKKGDVDWFFDDDGVDCFKVDQDIPTMIEELYELKEKSWYSRYWTFDEFIKDSISYHAKFDRLELDHNELVKDAGLNTQLLEQSTKTIGIQTKQIEQLQKDAQENTVQMGLITEQVREANKQKALMETDRDKFKKLSEDVITERDTLKSENRQLKEKLIAGLKGYSKGELFRAWLGIYKLDK